jgi:hypothetical protein
MLLLILLLILIFAAVSYVALQSWLGLLSKRRPGHDPIDPGRSNVARLYPHIVPFNITCVSVSI